MTPVMKVKYPEGTMTLAMQVEYPVGIMKSR
jgi:hypothetical protein